MSTDSERRSPWELQVAPPVDRWDDWTELDSAAWPERVERRYRCVPGICFNCESACGLLAFVDEETGEIRRFEGNPVHPGSRGRTCAKGPATINQVHDPERILKPLRRVGRRGEGRFEEATWEEALEDIGSRIRRAFDEERHGEVVYHVGRPGDDHFVPRMLQAWGIDGHDSHTNVCSSSARLGFSTWQGADRPSPDFVNARFIMLLSAHLETGHYFNPHAQRLLEAKQAGARMAVVDPRLSNTTAHADLWVSPWPGTEACLMLGLARELLRREAIDREFIETWVNWRESCPALGGDGSEDFDGFLELLAGYLEPYSPEFVAEECRLPGPQVVEQLASEIAAAGNRFASHLWRGAASGHLHGWQVARCLLLLHVLTGSLGRKGGVNPNSWDKFVPKPSENPPPISRWNERIWPREFPIAHYEMSFILPHLLERQGTRIDTYFTRVYNPVWTNPDGGRWIRMLEEDDRIGCHVALTPIWSETAHWADWVLPMGLGPERHDLMSQETHAGTWLGFRQPILREWKRRRGEESDTTLGTNPGQVWEEAEFWIALTWKIDPDGSLGMRRWYESKERPGEPITLDEYYADIFESSVPGLPETAAAEGMTPLEYMRRRGACEVPYAGQERFDQDRGADEPGVDLDDGRRKAGFPTLSGKLELHSQTLVDWGFGDQALPGYQPSQVNWRRIDFAAGQRALLPTFRLPTLIHTRSGNAKWLQEISHQNPLWVCPTDADELGLKQGGLARVETEIGHFIAKVWVTEGIHPGVVACSHHLGRWRLHREIGGQRQASAWMDLERDGTRMNLRRKENIEPFESGDPDTERIWWKESGVHQNLTFPVQPDPASGMHCWHQLVTVRSAEPGDRIGDVSVDLARSEEVFQRWLEMTKPAPGPGGLRRPLHMNRPLKPTQDAYRLDE
ncbi:MAG: molybdopterin dinucleotide binding domain-containing protein [Acidobacteriota bacterium]